MKPEVQSPYKSITNTIRDGYHLLLSNLDPDEFTLFHLTTTYLPYQDRTYTARDLNKFFTNFYLKNLLPDLFHTRTWTRSKKLNQPIVLSFLDEHVIKSVPVGVDAKGNPTYAHPIRLHHHSIVAQLLARVIVKNFVVALAVIITAWNIAMQIR